MNSSFRYRWIAAVLFVAHLLIGCGDGGDGPSSKDAQISDQARLRTDAPSITSAHLSARTTNPSNPAPNVDVSITDVASIRALFDETLSLPVVDRTKTSNCPTDFGVTYRLSFEPSVLTVTIDPSGCGWVTSTQFTDTLSTSPTYFRDLATTLGINEAQIYPYTPATD